MTKLPADSSDTVPLSDYQPSPSVPKGRSYTLLFYGNGGTRALTVKPGDEHVVGREAPADFVVPDGSMSRTHARVSIDDEGRLCISDLGSKNGLFLAGEPVSDVAVRGGEDVALGAVTVGIHPIETGRGVEGIEPHDRFIAHLDDEVVRARSLGRSATLALIHTPGHIDACVQSLMKRVRPVDRIATYSDQVLEVLLPEADATDGTTLLEGLSEHHDGLSGAVVTLPLSGANAQALLAVALDALKRATPGSVVNGDTGGARDLSASDDGLPIVVSEATRELFALVDRAAKSSIPVLVHGETGAGKEVVAQQLHARSRRRDERLVSVNCGALAPQLVESTLFGHEKGAFTGADERRVGVFERASGGTVFLDEIGELREAAQAALLRVLETGTITRVGSTEEIDVDVRIVAATHRDLQQTVADGGFREDLLFRLNTLVLLVPPLRERREEIRPLAERFLGQMKDDTTVRHIDDDAMACLEAHAWPGNVRELRNVIARGAVLASGDRLQLGDLPDGLRSAGSAGSGAPSLSTEVEGGGPQPAAVDAILPEDAADDEEDRGFKDQMRDREREVLLTALEKADGVQTEAARRLGMPLRTFLYRLKKMGIRREGRSYAVSDDED